MIVNYLETISNTRNESVNEISSNSIVTPVPSTSSKVTEIPIIQNQSGYSYLIILSSLC